jgi:hypothetical protein
MERVWYLGGWYQRRASNLYPFAAEQWDVYDGVHRHLVYSEARAKEVIEERWAHAHKK